MSAERLHKVLARAGLGSRREIETWIAAGRITVNGQPATTGMLLPDRARVEVDGKPVRLRAPRAGRVLAYHKPAGEICTRNDPAGRRTVFESLPRLRDQRWISIGRLDFNTSGLLLFTTDGELAHRLTHPSGGVDREYLCRVQGEVTKDFLKALREGIDLDGRQACFESVSREGGTGSNRWYRVVIREGRYREVRRMWAEGGYRVSRLIRVRYGPVQLPRDLKPGTYMNVPPTSVEILYGGRKPESREAAPRKESEDRPSRKVPSGEGAGDRRSRKPSPGERSEGRPSRKAASGKRSADRPARKTASRKRPDGPKPRKPRPEPRGKRRER